MLDCHIHIERGNYTLEWIDRILKQVSTLPTVGFTVELRTLIVLNCSGTSRLFRSLGIMTGLHPLWL